MSSPLHFLSGQIDNLEKQYRTNFINALSGFRGVHLCGTIGLNGITNLAIFNSIVHIGANPPLLGMILRPATVPRHTLQNILDTGCYTLNHVHKFILHQAHQSSARYGAHESEFAAVGLHEEYSPQLKAPYVRESLIKIGLSFAEKHEITSNNTTLLIGRIEEVFVPSDCLAKDGYLDLHRAGSLTIAGLDAYHSTEKLVRLDYARPGVSTAELDGFPD
jgi:flavin reductase (DIM6/NTAB) family NADH-FMN oxidoreductase RutF